MQYEAFVISMLKSPYQVTKAQLCYFLAQSSLSGAYRQQCRTRVRFHLQLKQYAAAAGCVERFIQTNPNEAPIVACFTLNLQLIYLVAPPVSTASILLHPCIFVRVCARVHVRVNSF